MKGIIYRAYNKISKKSYIGQTINTLEYRVSQHIRLANRTTDNYHFVNALRFYNKEDWEWTIVEADIEQELLNEKEISYIKQFDTFENGYNSNYGGTTIKVPKIHSFYHKEHGHIEVTVKEMCERFNGHLSTFSKLTLGKLTRYRGWIMSANVDRYEAIVNPPKKVKEVIIKPIVVPTIYTITYRDKGKFTGTKKEIANAIGVSEERVRQMIVNPPEIKVKKVKQHDYWIYTMTNGTITESLTSIEWETKYGVKQVSIHYIVANAKKNSLWKFITKFKNIS